MPQSKKVDQLFAQWSGYFKFEKNWNIVFLIAEAVAAIVFGALVGREWAEMTNKEWIALTISGLAFLFLFFHKSFKEQFFPMAAIGEMKATLDLQDRERALNRKRNIDRYIDGAVQALNTNTCNYSDTTVEEYLCDSSLEEGFKSVYQPFLQNPSYLFDTPLAKFTVGITLEGVLQLPAGFETGTKYTELSYRQPVTICPKDDLQMEEFFVQTMLWDGTLEDLSFYFQKQIQDTFKHSKFITDDFTHNNVNYTMITASVPQVCEDAGSRGVLFIISEALSVPDDLSDVSIIFSRLFSNWLSKYEDCVLGRLQKSNQEFEEKRKTAKVAVPPEVVALGEKSGTGSSGN